MKLRSNYFAASVLFLCSGGGSQLEAARQIADAQPGPKPAYAPLTGTLTLGLGFTADRIEGGVDLLAPLFLSVDGRRVFFLDGHWNGKGDGNENGSAGFAFRQRFGPDIIIGINAFYDYGAYSGHGAGQFGPGFEFLSKWVDFRANAYFPASSVQPFGRFSETSSSSHKTSSSHSRTTSNSVLIDGGEGQFGEQLDDTLITTKTTTTTNNTRETQRHERRTFERQEGFMNGLDLELGGLIPYLDCLAETRIYGGYSFFDNRYGNDVNCFNARLESRPVPALIFDVQYKGDPRLLDGENHWYFGIRLEIPFDLGNIHHGGPFTGIAEAFTPQGRCWHNGSEGTPQRNRMNEEIIRNWRPTAFRTGYEKISDRVTEQTKTQSTSKSTQSQTVTIIPGEGTTE